MEQAPRKLTPAARRLSWLLMLSAWLFAGLLALEFFERARLVVGEYSAASYMKRVPPNPPFMRPATMDEQEHLRTQSVLPVEHTPKNDAESEIVAPQPIAETDEQRFWRLNASLDAREKQARATLDGEFWLLFDGEGRLETSLGDPYLEGRVCEHQYERLEKYPALAAMSDGESRTINDPSSPLWSYEIRRMAATAPDGGSRKTLFLCRLLMQNASLDALAAAYANTEQSHVLVPQYICRPNYRNEGVVTDQFGFVNHPVQVPKPAGVIRVVCIGGSTTHEDNPGGNRTTDFLQKLLDAEYPAGSIEIINCGIAGSGSNELRRHARDYLKYEPDLILYYEGINDIVAHLNARNWLSPLWKQALRISWALRRCFNRELVLDDETFEKIWHNTTQRNLLAIYLAAKEAGVPMAGVSFAYAQKKEMTWQEANYMEFNARTSWGGGLATFDTVAHLIDLHNQYLKSLFEELGLGYFPFAENFSHGMSHFKDLCHMTPLGMQERARMLHAWLVPWIELRLAELNHEQ